MRPGRVLALLGADHDVFLAHRIAVELEFGITAHRAIDDAVERERRFGIGVVSLEHYGLAPARMAGSEVDAQIIGNRAVRRDDGVPFDAAGTWAQRRAWPIGRKLRERRKAPVGGVEQIRVHIDGEQAVRVAVVPPAAVIDAGV